MLNIPLLLELGIGLVFISLGCFILGVLLLFDRALFLIGNMCFLAGIYLLIGFTGTVGFFMKKGLPLINIYGVLKKYGFPKSTTEESKNLNISINVFIGKLKGTAFFFGGFFVMVVLRIASVGFLLQIYGIFTLFKSFIPFVYESACSLPLIGKYLRDFTYLRRLIENLSKKKTQV